MSNAWKTTTDDVQTVLSAYDVELSFEQIEEIHSNLDHEDIEAGVLYYVTTKVQTDSMLSDIEDHLMNEGVIPTGEKKFVANECEDIPESEDEDDDDE